MGGDQSNKKDYVRDIICYGDENYLYPIYLLKNLNLMIERKAWAASRPNSHTSSGYIVAYKGETIYKKVSIPYVSLSVNNTTTTRIRTDDFNMNTEFGDIMNSNPDANLKLSFEKVYGFSSQGFCDVTISVTATNNI